MPAFTPHISEGGADGGGVVGLGPFHLRKPFRAKEAPYAGCGLETEEFTVGVEPGIVEAFHKEGTGGDAGNQHVLVEGKILFPARVFCEFAAPPVAEMVHFGTHILAEVSLCQRNTAAARLVDDRYGKAGVECAGKERGFSKTGTTG